MILALYRFLTLVSEPFVRLGLYMRARKGKEDKARLHERLGRTKAHRPEGPLLWVHAASVGESRSILPLLEDLQKARPNLCILLTTGTVTSAMDMAKRLPHNTIHQFVPVDHPGAVARFFDMWQPSAGLIVESELWPNLLLAAQERGVQLALVNGRLSPTSFRNWSKAPRSAKKILGAFSLVLAQDDETADRFRSLKAPNVSMPGNLKLAAPPLTFVEKDLTTLQELVGTRPCWVAASTHRGEEELIGDAHKILKQSMPDILTIIAPRHPERGTQIAGDLRNQGLITRLRSSQKGSLDRADIYVADTMGELGLFFTLCPLAFMGGSLIPHGGQNPLEPARLNCAVLTGPHIHNFAPTYAALTQAGAARTVDSPENLAAAIHDLLTDNAATQSMADAARKIALGNERVLGDVTAQLLPLIDAKASQKGES